MSLLLLWGDRGWSLGLYLSNCREMDSQTPLNRAQSPALPAPRFHCNANVPQAHQAGPQRTSASEHSGKSARTKVTPAGHPAALLASAKGRGSSSKFILLLSSTAKASDRS